MGKNGEVFGCLRYGKPEQVGVNRVHTLELRGGWASHQYVNVDIQVLELQRQGKLLGNPEVT